MAIRDYDERTPLVMTVLRLLLSIHSADEAIAIAMPPVDAFESLFAPTEPAESRARPRWIPPQMLTCLMEMALTTGWGLGANY